MRQHNICKNPLPSQLPGFLDHRWGRELWVLHGCPLCPCARMPHTCCPSCGCLPIPSSPPLHAGPWVPLYMGAVKEQQWFLDQAVVQGFMTLCTSRQCPDGSTAGLSQAGRQGEVSVCLWSGPPWSFLRLLFICYKNFNGKEWGLFWFSCLLLGSLVPFLRGNGQNGTFKRCFCTSCSFSRFRWRRNCKKSTKNRGGLEKEKRKTPSEAKIETGDMGLSLNPLTTLRG